MECFKCKKVFENIDILLIHFKHEEFLKHFSNYKCTPCNRIFSNLSQFKSHYQKQQHVISKETLPLSTTEPFFENISQILIENVVPSQNLITPENEKVDRINIFDEVTEFQKEMLDGALKVILTLISQNNLPRNVPFLVIQLFNENIFHKLSKFLKTFNNNIDKSAQADFDRFSNTCGNLFSEIDTEAKLVVRLKELNVYQEPTEYIIDHSVSDSHALGKTNIDFVAETGMLMPIQFQMKNFFERPGILDMVLNEIDELETASKLVNFVNGTLWNSKIAKFPNKICIPYFLYTDGVCIDNYRGTHAMDTSLTAYYYNFPTLPPHWLSSLKNIFVALVYCSKQENHGLTQCLYKLTDIIKTIENEGIAITVGDASYTVHFILGVVLGDNLGLHAILGFSKSFSSTLSCRFCKATKEISRTAFEEDEGLIRKKEEYFTDLQQPFIDSGLKEQTILIEIDSFHPYENFSVDTMHDIIEGVCHYDLSEMIKHFLKFTTLETINHRKRNFDYGILHSGNRSPDIQMGHLNKSRLQMTASEMLTFIFFFPLMIGDLVPYDGVWEFLLYLIQLLNLVMSPTFDNDKLSFLKITVEKHNKLYITLFQQHLKPKFHHLLHYCRVIAASGPLKYLWVMRFEAKHAEFVSYCRSMNSRKNISKSVGLKSCFKYAYSQLYDLDFDQPTLQFDKDDNFLKLACFETIKDFFSNYNDVKLLKSAKYNGILYKKLFFLVKDTSLNDVALFRIEELIFYNEEIMVITNQFNVIGFDFQYASFLAGDPLNQISVQPLKEFSYPPIELHKKSNSSERLFQIRNF